MLHGKILNRGRTGVSILIFLIFSIHTSQSIENIFKNKILFHYVKMANDKTFVAQYESSNCLRILIIYALIKSRNDHSVNNGFNHTDIYDKSVDGAKSVFFIQF